MEKKMNSYSFPPFSFLPLQFVQPCNIYDASNLLVFDTTLDRDVLVRPDVDFHAVADGHVLRLRAAHVGQILAFVLREEPYRYFSSRRNSVRLARPLTRRRIRKEN